MATRMLIDARHTEETRVAVLKGNRIEEFDFESAEHKQIKGNIYLAKVTRVEPSLQAAFVDYGGNRHGFLAFSEIHPDYYQIPKEDREALLAEEAEAAEEEARLRAEEEDQGNIPGDEYDADEESSEALAEDLAEDGLEEIDTSDKDHVATIEEGQLDGDDHDDDGDNGDDGDGEDEGQASRTKSRSRGRGGKGKAARGRGARSKDNAENDDDENGDSDDNHEFGDAAENDEDVDDSDEGSSSRKSRGSRGGGRKNGRARKKGGSRSRAKEVDEARAKRLALRRRYKIQDVIQRRQVLLVQVVKEERGNKGAALTSYLSLAGRYTVLMPNSSHGGGISRKISSVQDRKRLKQIISDLKLPKSMGLIVRTAGLSRTKPEVKRDFDYLARLWDRIREATLGSSAPALIHSDSDLIKRAIRDIYNRDIEEVIVEGETGYKSAKQFMKLLMPSHARRVKAYSNPVPLFQRYGAEDQLRAMYDPVVQLKSGGYLVINPTEALVSIDINSGRSTKEHGIEQTATATNMEAAREIARQLRLRDMAGLVVIDFIDMDYNSNIRKVERAMKDALKNDRARIQVGRISGFGLMEMSRQRLRTGVLEATTRECNQCAGTGLVLTASSAGLSALRMIEDEAARAKGSIITLSANTEAAVYLLNSKRADLSEIEDRYHVSVEVIPLGENEGSKLEVGSSGPRPSGPPKFAPIQDDDDSDDDTDYADIDEDESDDRPQKKRRRRGGRGRGRGEDGASHDDRGDRNSSEQQHPREEELDEDGNPKKKRRRRGGRGRRGRGRGGEGQNQEGHQQDGHNQSDRSHGSEGHGQDGHGQDGHGQDGHGQGDHGQGGHGQDSNSAKSSNVANAETGDQRPASAKASETDEPKPKRGRRKKADTESVATTDAAQAGSGPHDGAEGAEAISKPKATRRKRPTKAEQAAAQDAQGDASATTEAKGSADTEKAEKPKRTRRKKSDSADADKDAKAEGSAGKTATSSADEKPKPVRKSRAKSAKAKTAEAPSEAGETIAKKPAKAQSETAQAGAGVGVGAETKSETDAKSKPSGRGWWQRTFGD